MTDIKLAWSRTLTLVDSDIALFSAVLQEVGDWRDHGLLMDDLVIPVTVGDDAEPVQVEIEELDGDTVKLRIRRSGTRDVRIEATGKMDLRWWAIRDAEVI